MHRSLPLGALSYQFQPPLACLDSDFYLINLESLLGYISVLYFIAFILKLQKVGAILGCRAHIFFFFPFSSRGIHNPARLFVQCLKTGISCILPLKNFSFTDYGKRSTSQQLSLNVQKSAVSMDTQRRHKGAEGAPFTPHVPEPSSLGLQRIPSPRDSRHGDPLLWGHTIGACVEAAVPQCGDSSVQVGGLAQTLGYLGMFERDLGVEPLLSQGWKLQEWIVTKVGL